MFCIVTLAQAEPIASALLLRAETDSVWFHPRAYLEPMIRHVRGKRIRPHVSQYMKYLNKMKRKEYAITLKRNLYLDLLHEIMTKLSFA